MKKYIHVGDLKALSKSPASNGLMIAMRSGDKVMIQNLDSQSPNPLTIKYDKEGQKLVIEIVMRDGEYVALKDLPGFTEKRWI